MLPVTAVREASRTIAHAQMLLRESRDKRALVEVEALEERAQALADLLDEMSGVKRDA